MARRSAAVAVAVAAATVVTYLLSGGGSPAVGGVTGNDYPVSTTTVARESISQQTQVSATLGYAGEVTVRLPGGNAPTEVTGARQTVAADHELLAGARSVLRSEAAALTQARATLVADRGRESTDCAGDHAAPAPASAGSGSSGAAGECAADAQRVATDRQSVATDAINVATAQSSAGSAHTALVAARASLWAAAAQATVFGRDSVYTSVPSAGAVVRRGQQLFAINGEPVLLLYGADVATRAFAPGMSPGADVAALNANLDALGYAHRLAGDAFTTTTAAAIRRLQAAHGELPTGKLLLGSVIFEVGPVRVTSAMPGVAVGSGVVAGPVLSGTWLSRQVSIQLDAGLEGQVRVGDPVAITLPDNDTTPARITYVSPVATGGQGGATIHVDASPTDPEATGRLDHAPVNVSITTATARDVLVVPVDALLARPDGGYAVEEVDLGRRHQLVEVRTGLFDDADGLVQVSGSRLAAGQHVVVPGE